MRFLVMVKANKGSEAGSLPTQEMLAEMGKFNDELVKAGVMLAGEGLQASSKGARITYASNKPTVRDGPFAETKELVAGFWIWQVKNKAEALSGRSAFRSRRARSKSGRSSRLRISAPRSRPSCASRKSGSARRSQRTNNARGNNHAIHDHCEDARDRRATVAGAHRQDRETGRGRQQAGRDGWDGRSRPDGPGRACATVQRQDHGDRRSLHRSQGSHRRLRDLRRGVEAGSHRVD